MRGHHLAVYNFGLHVDAYESPRVEGFRLREAPNFEAATRAEGFVGRSGYDGEPGPESWGEKVYPRFLQGSGFTDAPSSLSLWTGLEALMAFTYNACRCAQTCPQLEPAAGLARAGALVGERRRAARLG